MARSSPIIPVAVTGGTGTGWADLVGDINWVSIKPPDLVTPYRVELVDADGFAIHECPDDGAFIPGRMVFIVRKDVNTRVTAIITEQAPAGSRTYEVKINGNWDNRPDVIKIS